MDFGRRLRAARTRARLTQDTLAKRVGLSRTSITNIERGNQHVALHHLFELSRAVGVPPAELLPDASGDGAGSSEALLSEFPVARRQRLQRDLAVVAEEDRHRILRILTQEVGSDGRTEET